MRELSDEQWKSVEAELFAGRKIQAIKLVREATGCGLKEAKDVVDEHEKALRASSPEKFTRSKSGCVGMLVFLVFVGAALTIIFSV